MATRGNPSHLMRQGRSDNWYYRRAVPMDLKGHIGKREIWRSLKTADRQTALRKSRQVADEIDALFDAARQRRDAKEVSAVPEFELVRIARWLFRQEMARFEKGISSQSEEFLEGLDAELDLYNFAFQAGFWDGLLDRKTTDALEAHGYRLDPDTDAFARARFLLTRAMYAANRTAAGQATGDFDFASADAMVAPCVPLAPTPSSSNGHQGSITLGELLSRYENDPARSQLTQKTKDQYKTIHRVLRDLLGEDRPVRSVTRDDCRRVRDVLLKLPPNFSKRWPKLTAEQVIAIADQKDLSRMAPTSVNSYLVNLSALFNYAVVEEYVDRNPAQKLTVAVDTKKKERRLPFSAEQLRLIFNAPLYTGCQNDENGYATPGPQRPRRGRFWVPLLALFTGMRLNECCQLHTADIKEIEGVDCIVVREDAETGDSDKRVKSAAGERIVPVHPELVRLGFLDYVKRMRRAGDPRLFPELPKGKNGYYSDPFSKWFSRFLKGTGAAKPLTTFHSFRHCFRDGLREAGVPEDRIRALGGWAENGGSETVYGAGLKAKTLHGEIKKLKYPVDLGHLSTS